MIFDFYGEISIHPPRAGWDIEITVPLPPITKFQSTRPMRGGTRKVIPAQTACRISIHPPRAGRDMSILVS